MWSRMAGLKGAVWGVLNGKIALKVLFGKRPNPEVCRAFSTFLKEAAAASEG